MLFLMMTALLFSVFFVKSDVYAASKPAKVKAKVVSSSSSAIKIKWNNVAKETGYYIYRRVPGGKYKIINKVKADTTSYTDKTVASATVYDYAVRAYKKTYENRGKYKAVRTAANPASVELSVSGKNSGVQISWNKVARVEGYRIWRKKANGKEWSAIKKVNKSKTSYTDANAAAGTKYNYCVWGYITVSGERVHGDLVESEDVCVPAPAETEKSGTMTAAQKEVMKKIIYAVESGGQVYGKQDYSSYIGPGTNTSNEVAITIGAGQWYATEAQRLLKLIYDTDSATFKKYDENGNLWKDVQNKSWSTYVPNTSAKVKKIKNIISSSVGIKCQDKLMIAQIDELAAIARNRYGVTTISGQAEAINIIHQGGESALKRILAKTKKPYTAKTIYAALCTDPADRSCTNQVGDYVSRQEKVYSFIQNYLK